MDEGPNKSKKIRLKLTDYSSARDLGNRVGFVKYGQDGWGKDLYSMQQVIAVQSKFPVKIREAIRMAQRRSPEQFFEDMENFMEYFFGHGYIVYDTTMNSEIDTEEEVEYAIRVFPSILGPGYFMGSRCDLNAFPFYPLVMELRYEYRPRPGVALNGLVNFFVIRMGSHKGEDIDIKLNEMFHSILLRLKENCMAKASKEEIRRSVDILLEDNLFRSQKMLHILLDWEPSLLEEFSHSHLYMYRSPLLDRSPLSHYFLEKSVYPYSDDDERYGNGSDGDEVYMSFHAKIWKGFQTLFELGITHYPKELGFVFHSFDFKTSYFETSERRRGGWLRECHDTLSIENPFRVVCYLCGKERVTKYVMEILLKLYRGCSYGMRTLLLSVVDDPNIEADTLYYLLRSDPISLIPAKL